MSGEPCGQTRLNLHPVVAGTHMIQEVNIKLTSASLDNETAPSAQESSKLPDDPDITNPNPHDS
jgi:hypothetical protein